MKNFDYTQNGFYFVTICSQNREEIFGEIKNNQMILNDAGRLISRIWNDIPKNNFGIGIDKFCVMPNHIHGIIFIKCRGVIYHARINNDRLVKQGAMNCAPTSLGRIIRLFKGKCTFEINKLNRTQGYKIFQRNYYERIIRNEKEYLKIKEYIGLNPRMWEKDRNNIVLTTL